MENNYQIIAENLHQEGKTLDEILEHIKNLAYTDSISGGINENQSKMFSLEVAQNSYRHIQAIIDGVLSPILTEQELSVMPTIDNSEERINICKSCPYVMSPETSFIRCKICNCMLELKTKSEVSRCPIGKW